MNMHSPGAFFGGLDHAVEASVGDTGHARGPSWVRLAVEELLDAEVGGRFLHVDQPSS